MVFVEVKLRSSVYPLIRDPYGAARTLGCPQNSAHKKRGTPKHGVTQLHNTTTDNLFVNVVYICFVPQWDIAQALRVINPRNPTYAKKCARRNRRFPGLTIP